MTFPDFLFSSSIKENMIFKWKKYFLLFQNPEKQYSDPIWKFRQCHSLDIGPYNALQKWDATIFGNSS